MLCNTLSGATYEPDEKRGTCETEWSLWCTFTAPATADVIIETKLTPTSNGTNFITIYEIGTSPTSIDPGTQSGCVAGVN